ncbi:beta-glucosidase [Caballeronia arvi]|nr:glycoside hydrolase family 3 C-terminal domain-containing protein [Caballeronia arvi]
MKVKFRRLGLTLSAAASVLSACGGGSNDSSNNPALNPTDTASDVRASAIVAQMTLDEKISQVHGAGTTCAVSGASCIPGIPRLGIPDQVPTDSSAGVKTSLPNNLALAATFDTQLAYAYGDLIGKEVRQLGFTESLGGGVNIARELRNGRNYEYLGEDPLLTGDFIVARTKAVQAHKVVSTVKHFAANSQETNRYTASSNVDERTLRELYLLPFEMAVKDSQVGNVMCAYNFVNGIKACQNAHLITDILKNEWGFKGKVQSDWELALDDGVQGANAGLDEEETGSANDYVLGPFGKYSQFNQRLKAAVQSGAVPTSRLNDMVKRKLRTLIEVGVLDDAPTATTIPADQLSAGAKFSQSVAEQSMVLLKNAVHTGSNNATLPLTASTTGKIVVIGGNADRAVMGGGGSGHAPGADASVVACFRPGTKVGSAGVEPACAPWYASSPLSAIKSAAPNATVSYIDGTDAQAASAAASNADAAIVFATRFQSEDIDLPSLSLSNALTDPANQAYDQDALITAVSAKAKRVIVVLEVGTAVTMPWIDSVDSVLVAWYPGPQGGPAIADVLFGAANPSAKLPISFPKRDADLPEGPITGESLVYNYTEELNIGYRWFDAKQIEPLFPFGFGLSYTTYAYGNVSATPDGQGNFNVTFTVTNTGTRAGVETPQVYAGIPFGGEPPKRLVAYQKVALAPGESKNVTLNVDAKRLGVWDDSSQKWILPGGSYSFYVGGSSRNVLATSGGTVTQRSL